MKITLIISAYIALVSSAPKITKLDSLKPFKQHQSPALNHSTPKIVGGIEAVPHSLPYQAFIEFHSTDKGWYCGGSLISENFVITAARCAYEAREIVVILGAHRPELREETQVVLPVRIIVIHEDFDPGSVSNNIALLRLPEPVRLTTAIQPINLPSRGDIINDFAGEIATASGWGLTDGHEISVSNVLRYADVRVLSHRECQQFFGNIGDSILCTSGDDNSGTCNGDTGGPLALQNMLIGVVSFGFEHCPRGFPSGFVRITSYLSWISRHSDVEIH